MDRRLTITKHGKISITDEAIINFIKQKLPDILGFSIDILSIDISIIVDDQYDVTLILKRDYNNQSLNEIKIIQKCLENLLYSHIGIHPVSVNVGVSK